MVLKWIAEAIHKKTRPTPISRVRDLQNDLAWLSMTWYTLKLLKMTNDLSIRECVFAFWVQLTWKKIHHKEIGCSHKISTWLVGFISCYSQSCCQGKFQYCHLWNHTLLHLAFVGGFLDWSPSFQDDPMFVSHLLERRPSSFKKENLPTTLEITQGQIKEKKNSSECTLFSGQRLTSPYNILM